MKLKMRMFFPIWIAFLTGCHFMNSYNAHSLKKYFLSFIDTTNIKFEEISVGMFDSTREGYYIFDIQDNEFNKLKQSLSLKEITAETDIRAYMVHYADKIGRVSEFEIRTESTGQQDGSSRTSIPSETKIYRADPPLPPMEGNTDSSFVVLFYDSARSRVFVVLTHPYG